MLRDARAAFRERLGAIGMVASEVGVNTNFAEYFKDLILPALAIDQMLITENARGDPTGYAAWAYLTQDVARRVINQQRTTLHISEWTEGSLVWIIEFQCLPGCARQVYGQLLDKIFQKQRIGKVTTVHYMRMKNGKLVLKEILLS